LRKIHDINIVMAKVSGIPRIMEAMKVPASLTSPQRVPSLVREALAVYTTILPSLTTKAGHKINQI